MIGVVGKRGHRLLFVLQKALVVCSAVWSIVRLSFSQIAGLVAARANGRGLRKRTGERHHRGIVPSEYYLELQLHVSNLRTRYDY